VDEVAVVRRLAEALVQALYLWSPLLVSVGLSAIVHKCDLFRSWKVPIDGGRTFRGKRIFGDGKTWRGVAIAVFGSIATVAFQKHVLLEAASAVSVVDYARVGPFVFGGTMAVAAMAGELPNSFVKRRLGIASGETARAPLPRAVFWTWDQVDLLTLSWPALLPWVRPSAVLVLASFALALVLHPLVAWIGFAVGARKTAR
jgi:CDP-2,3-bis-(O-geranylgeranyl)-sn-glycerol synthase